MSNFKVIPKPLVLAVIDGFGVAPEGNGNAVTSAKTPNMDQLWREYPHGELYASGSHVGLPNNEDGNSEVGHMNMGAGRLIPQEVVRIDSAIKSGNFFKNNELLNAIKHAEKNDSNIHIIGLVGNGVVHSKIEHLEALLDLLSEKKVNGNKIFLHIITDGRDSKPFEAEECISRVEYKMKKLHIGHIATLIGRYYAMDRDERFERTEVAYKLFTENKGIRVEDWKEALESSYKQKIDDQYVKAYSIANYDESFPVVSNNDSVIFFNYRGDRAVQLSRLFQGENPRNSKIIKLRNLYFVGLSNYEKGFPEHSAFPHSKVDNTLGEIISSAHLRQLRISESEKFAHVTYFFNGGREEIFPGEDRVEIQSDKSVEKYDENPEMSLGKLTKVLLEKIDTNIYDFILLNIANPDMVAHTGNFDATVKAIEYTDKKIGEIAKVVLEKNGVLIITSDHGNAEELLDKNGMIDTKHSVNPVPITIVRKFFEPRELEPGVLSDVAPTILGLLGIRKPASITGRNLLK